MDAEIDKLLRKWNEAKLKIKELENTCDRYKKLSEKIMKKTGKDIIENSEFFLERRVIGKSTISKSDVPKDLWEKYSKKSSYPAFYLRKK